MTFPKISQSYTDPHRYPEGVAFLDAQYLKMRDAKVSVLDWGFLHSDATYDTVHVWDGAFFRLDLHLNRFFEGLAKLRMTIPFDRDEVTEILKNCVALSGHRKAYVEMICTRGGSPSFSRDPREATNRFMAFAVPYASVANADQMKRGLDVAISDVQRIPPKSVDPSIKNYHWLDLVRGLYDAYDKGAETALILDTNGNIAEGPGFNVFVVSEGALITPDFGVLPGITRRTVFDLCDRLDIGVSVGAVSTDALTGADEVFVTSTAGGIMPVRSVDAVQIGSGEPGPVTTQIKELYWKMHYHPEWTTPVAYPEGI
ncbi:aminotransferase class IV [Nitratireductor thuwali]|uniref:Probable branched-chain-amino-acid aminotransferase n=1 Tax=Nitratireductor thuwali TaxID=2267699 RepID=A0ABY5MHG9_9HYPH|nr:Branched-chain-amino-acid aminotransferase [Nitratireductor thuwali]